MRHARRVLRGCTAIVLTAAAFTYSTAPADATTTVPASTASSAFAAFPPVARQLGQLAGAAARRAAASPQAKGSVRLTFPERPPIVVPAATVEVVAAQVDARANAMVLRHVENLTREDAIRVVERGCRLKFAADLYGEQDRGKRIQMLLEEFGGNRMLVSRMVSLAEEMEEKPDDRIQLAATAAVCEAVGFVPRR